MQPHGDTTPSTLRRIRERADVDGSVLVCTAQHPKAGDGTSRFTNRIHGIRLQHVPFLARPTYREVTSWSDARPGCLIVRCSSSDCRAFSEYEIMGPVRVARGVFLPSHLEPGARAPDEDGVETPFGALRTAIRRIRSLARSLVALSPRTSPTLVKELFPMERLNRFRRVPLVLALAGFAAACGEQGSDLAGPIIPGDPALNPQVSSAAWTLDVIGSTGRIYVRPPAQGLDGLSQSIVADYFGLQPGHPELSILGDDVIELDPSGLDFGIPRALPGVGSGFVRDVSWNIAVRNQISGIELIAPTFPTPPAGVTTPVIIPFNQIVTVTSGSVGCEVGTSTVTSDCFIEAPSEGNVFVSDAGGVSSAGLPFSDGYQGAPSNFFNESPCPPAGTYFGEGNQSDCRPFKAIGQVIAGGATAAPVKVNYTIDQTVNQFRVLILVAADIQDGVPDTTPPVISGIASNSPQRVGNTIVLTGSATDDRTAVAAITWGWDFSAPATGPFTDDTGNPAQFVCSAPGTFVVGAQATDGASNSSIQTVSITCVTNAAPVVAFVGAPYSTTVSTSVSVNAGASTDDLGIATYEISINGGTTFGAPQASPLFSVTCPATPQTLNIVVRATDAPEGAQGTGSTTVTCDPPANVFLLWTTAAGAPITGPVAVGTQVRLQICVTTNTTQAIQGNLSVPGYGAALITQVPNPPASNNADLNAATQGAGACDNPGADGSDVVDQFSFGVAGAVQNFQNFSIAAAAGTGVVGIANFLYTANGVGTVVPSFAPTVWSLFGGGAAPTAVLNPASARTLTIQ
jgi:hypothetical protein